MRESASGALEIPETPNIEKERALDTKEYLAVSRKIGKAYGDFLKEAVGFGKAEATLPDGIPEAAKRKLQTVIRAAEDGFARLEARAATQDVDAFALLGQAFPAEKLADPSRFRLEKLSPGLFAVFIKAEAADSLIGGAQAVAAKVKDGISFVIIKEYDDEHLQDFQKRNVEENLPHETHHLAWDFAMKKGLVKSKEPDEERGKAFSVFQDELLARASSGGGWAGYHAFAKERGSNSSAETAALVSGLNEQLREMQEKAPRAGVGGADLAWAAMESESFVELQEKLDRIQKYIDDNAAPEPEETGGGWATV